MIRFANPEFLVLLVLVPILLLWHFRRRPRVEGTLRYSNLGVLRKTRPSLRMRLRQGLFVLRLLALSLLIIAFARPQSGHTEEEVTTEGIDIMLALDISSSMLAEDFKPNNRLYVAKMVASDFIRGRRNDRIGLVVFSGKSYTQVPLTLDYGVLLNLLNEVEIGMIEDGTAIGMALANSVNRLRNSRAKSKVIILLTDGRNNRGEIDPITGAQLAEAMGIRVYTIGVGKRGEALYPVEDPFFGKRYVRMPVQIDEKVLQQVAQITGGRYFRATNKNSLEQIFAEIDQLEKTKIEVKSFTRYRELFENFLFVALGLVLVEVVLANTKLRKLP
jgi:Ca-activated chloride channel family protein